MKRTLAFDLETSPNLGYIWGKYEQNVLSYERETHLLCYSYRWLDEKKTHVVSLPDFKNYKKDPTDDSALVQSLWKLFDDADILLAHNGDRFDIKYANARFLLNNLPPPTPYEKIDTLKIARSRFKLNSNKLNDLGKAMNLGQKVETGGFDLWLGCMAGDRKAWKRMCKYNKQDVDLLIAVYEKLKIWATNHPNMGDFDIPNCPFCESEAVQKRGPVPKGGMIRQRWYCHDCRGNSYSNIKEKLPLKPA